ncbi:kynurenine 3-monooxygenase, mitochondrial precursor [Tulasnella sp. 418]|nr:kynurenine 3-monooxygenase, mitochondrial precursor [Tulasnella sp. 418]
MGWSVDMYEGRNDLRLASEKAQTAQRSINLAISSRGILALHAVDPSMASRFLETAIPMKGRMIHDENGKLDSQLYDPRGQQSIYSVERSMLNEQLLDAASSNPNIRIFFQHKLVTVDFEKRAASFSRPASYDGFNVNVPFDFIVGADGSYSNVRRQLMRIVNMDYTQEYIPHQYVELRMPPGPTINGATTFLLDPNHLHIWPRHSFMLIALPNRDRSFTCTLFAPTADLARLNTPESVSTWFAHHFPDALKLIGEETLVRDVLTNPRGSLMSVKANPYHYKDRAIIIGDAAHAMVPFYGQGLNCGLEDVRVLQNILTRNSVMGHRDKPADNEQEDMHLASALEEYSRTRHEDLVAISQLAMKNYTEMRHDVTTPLYRLHRVLDGWLTSLTPHVPFDSLAPVLSRVTYPPGAARGWIPLYTMVTFRPDINYATVQARAERQTRVLRNSMWTLTGVAVAGGIVGGRLLFRMLRS